MLFSELVAEAVAHKAPNVQPGRLGTLLDLFGNSLVQEMTSLSIEEKLQGVAAARLSIPAISMYRTTLRNVFEWAMKTKTVPSNPVLSNGYHRTGSVTYAHALEALRAAEFLKKVNEQGLSPWKWGKGRAQLQREALSHIRRVAVAGEEWAEAIEALFFHLGESEVFSVRDKKKWLLAVDFVAKKPAASNREIAKFCGADKNTIQNWRYVKRGKELVPREDFQRAVQIERGEVPAEEKIRAENSSRRRRIALKKYFDDDPDSHVRASEAQKRVKITPKDLADRSARMKSLLNDPDFCRKRAEALDKPEVRESRRRAQKSSWTPKRRAKHSKDLTKRWKIGPFRAVMIEAQKNAVRTRIRNDGGRLMPGS